jgi:hypothetical protein
MQMGGLLGPASETTIRLPDLHRERKIGRTLNPIADGNHTAKNGTDRWRPRSAGWMAEQLNTAG